jgi:excisionase family DNA binding protein
MQTDWITTKEAADLLGYKNSRFVRALVKAERIASKPVDKRTFLVSKQDVERYAAARRTATPRPARQDAGSEPEA